MGTPCGAIPVSAMRTYASALARPASEMMVAPVRSRRRSEPTRAEPVDRNTAPGIARPERWGTRGRYSANAGANGGGG